MISHPATDSRSNGHHDYRVENNSVREKRFQKKKVPEEKEKKKVPATF
jgi:hypothetical protein